MALPDPHVLPIPNEDDRVFNYEVIVPVDENEIVSVVATDSLSFARDWVRKTNFLHAKHIHKLQVGVALRTYQPGNGVVLALTVGYRCLVIPLPTTGIVGCLASFLSAEPNRFVGLSQEPLIQLTNYTTAAQLGNDVQFFPVEEWNNWPLTQDQVNKAAIESRFCFLIALRDHLL